MVNWSKCIDSYRLWDMEDINHMMKNENQRELKFALSSNQFCIISLSLDWGNKERNTQLDRVINNGLWPLIDINYQYNFLYRKIKREIKWQ